MSKSTYINGLRNRPSSGAYNAQSIRLRTSQMFSSIGVYAQYGPSILSLGTSGKGLLDMSGLWLWKEESESRMPFLYKKAPPTPIRRRGCLSVIPYEDFYSEDQFSWR